MTIEETFMNKTNRDERARELKEEGYTVKKSSVRNQLLHPMYIKDYEKETKIKLSQADKGFGNTIYKTHFSAIYIVKAG